MKNEINMKIKLYSYFVGQQIQKEIRGKDEELNMKMEINWIIKIHVKMMVDLKIKFQMNRSRKKPVNQDD